MSVIIGGVQKSSLIDYPEKISAIVFTQGCNFRCPYCHNPELIQIKHSQNSDSLSDRKLSEFCYNESKFLEFLKTRVGKLDGVVITGGEPTLHKDLPAFIEQIKALGFAVKLDTNGTNPQMLQKLIDEKLIDYVAMDIKSPLDKYAEIVCAKVNVGDIAESIEILKRENLQYEFRTTVVESQLDYADFEKIAKLLKGAKKYYLQKFLPTKTLNKEFVQEKTYSDEEFENIIRKLEPNIDFVELR